MPLKNPTKLQLILVFLIPLIGVLANDQQRLDSLNRVVEGHIKADSLTAAVDVLNEVMDVYEYNGEWDNYYQTAEKVFALAKKSDDKSNLAEYYNKLGISSCLNGKNQDALDYFNKALAINKEIGNNQWVSNSYENLGLVYKDMGEYHKAIDNQMKSLSIREKEGHPRLAHNYSNISVLFEFIGEYDKQLSYIRKAMATAKTQPKNHELQAIVSCELGEYYLDYSDKLDSAIWYFQNGMKHCDTVGWNRGKTVFLGDLASAYYQKGDIAKSIDMHHKSLELSLIINDCMSICQEYNSLTELYFEIGSMNKAQQYALKAINQSENCSINYELKRAYENASALHASLNNFKLAYNYHQLFFALHDSIIGIEKHNSLMELETKYETGKKEQQIELLSTENKLKHQRAKTFTALIIALLLAVVIIITLYTIRQHRARERESELQQKLLRSQMNPHFIFNALGSIQHFMMNNETKKAAGYLGNFASLTRAILEKSSEELISLEDELNILRNYLELERMRTNERFDYKFEIEGDLETEFISIPPMMLQPFIENAIKHGFNDATKRGTITVSVKETNNQLIVTLKDNGSGIHAAKLQSKSDHKSMSMLIFNQRKKLIEKKLKVKIPYFIEDLSLTDQSKTGTRITIHFPQLETA